MFRFYQRGGAGTKERWHPVPEKKALELISKESVDMVTVLSVSDISRGADPATLKYRGDLYFDIDSDDVSVAIESARTLVVKLQSLGVATPQVYLSGKKGLHLVVPAKVFSDGKATTWLPYVYGMMAAKLDVPGLDHSVYSGGKGRMWRMPNRERADSGTYKVPITLDELLDLDESSYRAYVSQPRQLKLTTDKTPAIDLMQMFVEAKGEVDQVMKESSSIINEPDERLAETPLNEGFPGCLEKLVDGIDVKTPNFNRACLNFAGLMKVYGASQETMAELGDRLCGHNNYESVSYAHDHARKQHLKQILKRANADPNIGYNPGFLFSSIESCGGCVLCDGTLSGRAKGDDDQVQGNPIIEIDGEYYFRGSRNDRKLSTFKITPLSYSVLYDEDEDLNLRESIIAEFTYVVEGVRHVVRREIHETAWNSISNWKKTIEGVGNVVWLGSDNDLMLLKHYLFSKERDMDEIRKSSKVGIRVEESDQGKVLVYLEPGRSLNSWGEADTHRLTHNIPASPHVLHLADIEPENDDLKVLASLLRINERYKAGLMVGWFMAAHLKPHFQTLENQFPILSLWGNAGCGKTKSASVLGYLHGCDYEGSDSPASLGGTTPWAAAQFVASSTSTPRLLDEFNRPKLEKGGKYSKIADLVKAAWGNQPHMRGSVSNTKSGGAEVESLHMSGAIVIMSEQQPDEPPIIQRSIQVPLNRRGRRGCDAHWEMVYGNRKTLAQFGKHCVQAALRTPLSWVRERLDYWKTRLPSEVEIDSRPHYSFRCTLIGLDFMAKVLREQLDVAEDEAVMEAINEAQKAVLAKICGSVQELSQEKAVSVCDRVLALVANVAAEGADGGPFAGKLVSGEHFLRTGKDLYIDMALAFPQALRYSHSIRQPLEVTSLKMFKTLVTDEDYFLSANETVEFCPRPVWRFSVDKMVEKGLDVTLFPEGH